MQTLIANTSSITLDGLNISRTAPRPKADRQADYEERFDYKTLYYDVFQHGRKIILSGPPLFNLVPLMQIAQIAVDGVTHRGRRHLQDRWKTQRSYLEVESKVSHLSLDIGQLRTEVLVQPDHSDLFANRRTVFTHSKNNNLMWIKDWADFYVRYHGVEAVLIYDNGSTAYSPEDLLQTLKGVLGLEVIVIVRWNFKYGIGAGPSKTWDSDFCQYSAVEHARRRFLSRCRGVIWADVDELLVSDDGRSAFDYLDESESGAITYVGVWMETVQQEAGQLPPRHRHFRYNDKRRAPCTKKWTARPDMIPDEVQMNVHSFTGHPLTFVDALRHRHFRGIHTGWKNNRHEPTVFNPEVHEIDSRWVDVLNKLGWND